MSKSGKRQVAAAVTFFTDGTYAHTTPQGPTTAEDAPHIDVTLSPSAVDIIQKIQNHQLEIDDDRKTWLFQGNQKSAVGKINVRVGNLREAGIKHGHMALDTRWCNWCQEAFMEWLRTSPIAKRIHQTPMIADAPPQASIEDSGTLEREAKRPKVDPPLPDNDSERSSDPPSSDEEVADDADDDDDYDIEQHPLFVSINDQLGKALAEDERMQERIWELEEENRRLKTKLQLYEDISSDSDSD